MRPRHGTNKQRKGAAIRPIGSRQSRRAVIHGSMGGLFAARQKTAVQERTPAAQGPAERCPASVPSIENSHSSHSGGPVLTSDTVIRTIHAGQGTANSLRSKGLQIVICLAYANGRIGRPNWSASATTTPPWRCHRAWSSQGRTSSDIS